MSDAARATCCVVSPDGYPRAEELAGVDPAPAMLAAAMVQGGEPRLSFVRGAVEGLPFRDG